MAIGMCVACDEWFDESEYDWDVEMCLAHAEEHYEGEEELEYTDWRDMQIGEEDA